MSTAVPLIPSDATTNVHLLGSRRIDRAEHEAPATVTPLHGRETYTVADVSQMLSLALSGTYRMVRSGEIPAIKMGSRWVIPKRRFHAWLDGLNDSPEVPSLRPDTAGIARARVLSARHEAAMTQSEFADVLTVLLDRPVSVHTVEHWETIATPPGDVLVAAGIVATRGRGI